MVVGLVEYMVERQRGCGWMVSRNGAPVGRRCALVNAVDFATHLAEREAVMEGTPTRVILSPQDAFLLPAYHPWRRAA